MRKFLGRSEPWAFDASTTLTLLLLLENAGLYGCGCLGSVLLAVSLSAAAVVVITVTSLSWFQLSRFC